MGLGTKNRQKQTADICKQHLREKYRDQRGLVEEFILEFEGARKNCDVTRWDRFTDIKDIKKEMLKRLEAHFEKWLNPSAQWNESQLQKSGKRSAARLGVAKRGGEGGVGVAAREHKRLEPRTSLISKPHYVRIKPGHGSGVVLVECLVIFLNFRVKLLA